jgi:hypothetical protein
MVERCKFRVQENFRTFAERLEAYTVEELQLLPRAEWIEISQDFASRNSLPSQQRKYIKYRYNDRLIIMPPEFWTKKEVMLSSQTSYEKEIFTPIQGKSRTGDFVRGKKHQPTLQ